MQKAETAVEQRLQRHYDRFWSGALGRIRAGQIDLDPVLQARVPDRRRGLTLIVRPCAAVRQAVASFLQELRRLEPDQYYYDPSAFHLTVLSLFTATVDSEPFFAQTERYLSALDRALGTAAPFRIAFRGVTASRSALMIQGFLDTNQLHDVRNGVRRQLRGSGLANGLDQRYRLQTAHMTVVRFRSPLRRPELFAKAMETARRRKFGITSVTSIMLVENDWYMSQSSMACLKRYRLVTTS